MACAKYTALKDAIFFCGHIDATVERHHDIAVPSKACGRVGGGIDVNRGHRAAENEFLCQSETIQ